jgi:hypothetical protein
METAVNIRHLVAGICLPLTIGVAAHAEELPTGPYRVGAAEVDITPKESDLSFPTDSIRDHLFVRAIVIDNGKACGAIVGMDLGGARDAAVKPALAQAAQSIHCPAANFVVSATHTHSSNVGGLGVGAPTADTVTKAIVSAIEQAKTKLAPASIGYGTTTVDLNVNRDLYEGLAWKQAANLLGPSDKTLSVVSFIGADHVPIAVYMNYAMHPINFYLSGVISADFPGEASHYIEQFYGGKTVAVFSQGASGDQNPHLLEVEKLINVRTGKGAPQETVGLPPPPPPPPESNEVREMTERMKQPVPDKDLAAYKAQVATEGMLVRAEGVIIAEAAIDAMRKHTDSWSSAGPIWGGEQLFACPGRDRADVTSPARENVFPGYKDGPDVNLNVGLLRIGDINFARVNGEVYSLIAQKLKRQAPANKTIVVTLANGGANSGYIYSDDAYSHLTFQVIGSRLKPGCAEGGIIKSAIALMHQSGE